MLTIGLRAADSEQAYVPSGTTRPEPGMDDLTERMLWALVAAEYPVVAAHDFDAVYRTFGPALGPWLPVAVGREGGHVTMLAAGANTDAVEAMTAVAEGWRGLCELPSSQVPIPQCPESPAAGDVASHAPRGLLLRHGLARIDGWADRSDVPAERPLKLRSCVPVTGTTASRGTAGSRR